MDSPQRATNVGFDVFVHVSQNKRLDKQSVAGDLRRQGAHFDVTVMIVSLHIVGILTHGHFV